MVFVGALSCVVSCDNQMNFDSEKPDLAVILICVVRIYPSVSVDDNENEVLYLNVLPSSIYIHLSSRLLEFATTVYMRYGYGLLKCRCYISFMDFFYCLSLYL
jgi:hypothetical protein